VPALIRPGGPVAVPAQRSVARATTPRTRLVSAPGDTRHRLLLDLARDVTGAQDLGTVLDRTLTALRQILDFTGGSVQLIDENDHLYIAAGDPLPTPEALAMRVPVGQGVGGAIVVTGEPRYLPDITADMAVTDERRRKSVSHGVRSWFGVPLITEGRVIGLLQIDSIEADAWDEADRFMLLAFMPIVASAVSSAVSRRPALRLVE
jgi:GAF domain-containing protein